MPTRPERRRASIARLDRSRHGTLAIRFHWEGPVWEGVGVPDTPENRAAMPDADPARWVAPHDLASVIAFLGSGAARAVHGAAVPVTGLS